MNWSIENIRKIANAIKNMELLNTAIQINCILSNQSGTIPGTWMGLE
jgi:hypothetical protein